MPLPHVRYSTMWIFSSGVQAFHNVYCYPSLPTRGTGRFSWLLSINIWYHSKGKILVASLSDYCTLSLQQLISYRSGFLTVVTKEISAREFPLVSLDFLHLPVSPIWEKAVVFVSSSLLWIQNTLLIFPSFQLFPFKTKWGLPSPFPWNWNLKVLSELFYLSLWFGGVYALWSLIFP